MLTNMNTMMKHIILLSLALSVTMGASAAEAYCHKQLTAGDKIVYVTAKHVADNNYQLLIESDENLNGLGGSFIYVNGNEPYQLNTAEHAVLSADKRSITCDITSTAVPSHYTPLYVLFENGGEKNFGQPDADYSKSCDGTEPETPDTPDTPTDPVAWTDVEWIGNGSGNAAYDQMYKIRCAEGQQVANIQVAPWDNNNVGIYTWVESEVKSVSVDAGLQGSGMLLHLDAFTMQYTEVTIVAATKTYTCIVYYKNGTAAETGITHTDAATPATKVLIDGRLYIIRDGIRYSVNGTVE